MGGKSRANVKVEANRQPVGLSNKATSATGIRAAEGEDAPEIPKGFKPAKSALAEFVKSDKFPEKTSVREAIRLLREHNPEELSAIGIGSNSSHSFATMNPSDNIIKGYVLHIINESKPYKTIRSDSPDYIKAKQMKDMANLQRRYRKLLDPEIKIQKHTGNDGKDAFALMVRQHGPLGKLAKTNMNNLKAEWVYPRDVQEFSREEDAQRSRENILKHQTEKTSVNEMTERLNESIPHEEIRGMTLQSNNVAPGLFVDYKETAIHAGIPYGLNTGHNGVFHDRYEQQDSVATIRTDIRSTLKQVEAGQEYQHYDDTDFNDSKKKTAPRKDYYPVKTLFVEGIESKWAQRTRQKAEMVAEAEGLERGSADFTKRADELTDEPGATLTAHDKLFDEKRNLNATKNDHDDLKLWAWSVNNVIKKVALDGGQPTPPHAEVELTADKIKHLEDTKLIKNGQAPTIDSILENYNNDPDFLSTIRKTPEFKFKVINEDDLFAIKLLAEADKKAPKNLRRLLNISSKTFIPRHNYYAAKTERIALLAVKHLIQEAIKNDCERVAFTSGDIQARMPENTMNTAPFDRKFYDEILPKVVNQYIGKFGGQLQKIVGIVNGVECFDITPEMRKAVHEDGQDLV